MRTISRRYLSFLALLVAFGLLAAACGDGGSTPATADPDAPVLDIGDDLVPTTTTTSTAAPAEPAGTYDGIPVDFTDDGYARLGDPAAPVTLMEFSDYLCPFCGRHFSETTPQIIDQYVRSGQINMVFRDFPLAELHPTAPAGHAAALCVAEQGAALFWAYHNALFARQGEWSSLPDNGEFLASVASSVDADVGAYESCVESGRTAPIVDARVAEGRSFGFSGTPSFHFVDNRTDEVFEMVGAQPYETFASLLDAAIAGEMPVAADEPEPQLPLWATAEGVVPDPDRPGYNVAGDAWKGNPDAPLVVIEISDFQCPYCQRHVLETQPTLDELYVDTGRIMWVFKNLPLPSHPQAVDAAVGAECAGEQEAFWPMHDLLFATVDEWAVDPPDEALVGLAGELGLDGEAFSACYDGRTAFESVLADQSELSGVIGSTPTFVVLHADGPSVIEGAQPLEVFLSAFEELLGE